VLHVVQVDPQCVRSFIVSNAQGVVPLQSLNPALHETPHVPPLHVAAPLAGGGVHCVQFAPQWVGSVCVE
jgi:hypothetical protein